MLFFNRKIFFCKKSGSKCIRSQVKLILNTFLPKETFFMIWWQQAHFFKIFHFFFNIFPYGSKIHLSYHKSILLCLLCLNMYSCLILNNIWYVHIRHSSITTYEIFAFFRNFFNFCKNWNFFLPPEKIWCWLYIKYCYKTLVLHLFDQILIE